MKTLSVCTAESMLALGIHCSQFLKPKATCYLHGDLGTGKTTWTKGVLKGLGYEGVVRSPTYSIVNEHIIDQCSVAHFDLYRLTSSDDFLDSGLADEILRCDISLIEWPSNCLSCLPAPTAELYFKSDGSTHFVSVSEKQYTKWRLDEFELD